MGVAVVAAVGSALAMIRPVPPLESFHRHSPQRELEKGGTAQSSAAVCAATALCLATAVGVCGFYAATTAAATAAALFEVFDPGKDPR